LQHLSVHFKATGAESDAYLGIPLLLVVLTIAVRHWRNATVRIATVMTVILALFSMGPRLQVFGMSTIPLPWALIAKLPLMGNLLPVRLAVLTDLGVALLLAIGLDRLSAPVSLPGRVALGTVALVVVVSLLPSHVLVQQLSARVDVPAYFTSREVEHIPKGSIALVAPWTTNANSDLPEVWQAYAHFRFRLASGYAYLPSGKSGVCTGRLVDELEVAMRHIFLGLPAPDLSAPRVRAVLRQRAREHGFSTVVVGPMRHEDAMVRFMTRMLGEAPSAVGGVFVWYDVERLVQPRNPASAP
jgi:hypothetical protein